MAASYMEEHKPPGLVVCVFKSGALDWYYSYGDFAFWGHSGRDPGVRTHMYFNWENELGTILFQNNDEGRTIELLEKSIPCRPLRKIDQMKSQCAKDCSVYSHSLAHRTAEPSYG